MFNSRYISIRSKLVLMQVFTSVIVLGLCFGAFVISHIKDYKERKAANMIGLARLLGVNSISAFQFDDNDAAEATLSDLRNVSPEVVDASILDKHNKIFAIYKRSGADTFHFILPANFENKVEYTPDELLVFNNIVNRSDTLGRVCLRVQLDELKKIKETQYTIAIILLIVGVGLSFLIAFIVQRYISRRLLYLVNMMEQVSHTGDYHKRVTEDGRDEISTLSQVFNNLMDQIVDSQQKKDEFIGIASHELKTPLTSIKAYLQVLNSIENKDPNKQYIEKTLVNVNKLQQLIFDLLDVSKIQSGQLHLNINEFDINALLDEVITSFQVVSTNHRIIRKGTRTKQMIRGDRQRIEQVIINLLSNAVKYSPDENEVFVEMLKNNKEVIITVRDFGIGIPKEEQPRVFDRFYRTKSMSVLISGFGLGLYICKDIITRHSGQIWITSETRGTSFNFSLPLEASPIVPIA